MVSLICGLVSLWFVWSWLDVGPVMACPFPKLWCCGWCTFVYELFRFIVVYKLLTAFCGLL